MANRRPSHPSPLHIPPGVALIPEDFTERLTSIKERAGLTWEGLALGMGVDSRQILHWRKGGAPAGGAMLALVWLAIRVPDGLAELLNEDVTVIRGRGT